MRAKAPAPRPVRSEPAGEPSQSRSVSSEALFGDEQEVQIKHGELVYRLRRTSLGKLILTK